MFKALSGREPTPEEIADAKKELARYRTVSKTPANNEKSQEILALWLIPCFRGVRRVGR
jgi:hypothetical protein